MREPLWFCKGRPRVGPWHGPDLLRQAAGQFGSSEASDRFTAAKHIDVMHQSPWECVARKGSVPVLQDGGHKGGHHNHWGLALRKFKKCKSHISIAYLLMCGAVVRYEHSGIDSLVFRINYSTLVLFTVTRSKVLYALITVLHPIDIVTVLFCRFDDSHVEVPSVKVRKSSGRLIRLRFIEPRRLIV